MIKQDPITEKEIFWLIFGGIAAVLVPVIVLNIMASFGMDPLRLRKIKSAPRQQETLINSTNQ